MSRQSLQQPLPTDTIIAVNGVNLTTAVQVQNYPSIDSAWEIDTYWVEQTGNANEAVLVSKGSYATTLFTTRDASNVQHQYATTGFIGHPMKPR